MAVAVALLFVSPAQALEGQADEFTGVTKENTEANSNDQGSGKAFAAEAVKSENGVSQATAGDVALNANQEQIVLTKTVSGAEQQVEEQAEPIGKDDAANEDETASNTGKGDLEPGEYFIVSALDASQVLDVSGASKSDCGNVIVWHGSGNANQQWNVTFDEEGCATIESVNSGKVLDVEGASGKNGSNVIQYAANGGKNQKWIIERYEDAYVLVSALNNNLVLDLTGNSAKDGTNAEIWKRNNGKNQQFMFIAVTPVQVMPGVQVLDDGAYTMKAVSAKNTVVDIEGGSTKDEANALTWEASGAAWQAWYLEYDGVGYYTITSLNSGKLLAPAASFGLDGINVGQYSKSSDDRFKWVIASTENGQYTLTNKATGTYLAVGPMGKNNSANVQMSNNSQQFALAAQEAMPSGAVFIEVAANTKLALDVYGGSVEEGATLGTYGETGGLNERFLITQLEGGFTIRPYNSRMYLTASESGDLTQEAARDGFQSQLWNAVESHGFVTFLNATTGLAISVLGDVSKASSTVVADAEFDGSTEQKFYLRSVDAVPTGTYTIGLSSDQSLVVDVVGANRKNDANVDLWVMNGGNNQKFVITSLGDGVYKIANVSTDRVLDVEHASTEAGASVIMYTWGGGDNQKWHIELNSDFSLTITSVLTGYSLDTVEPSTAKGASVIVNIADSGSITQRFWFQDASKTIELIQIGVPCYMQNPELPTGCESVALTNALRYWGYKLGKTTIANSYMPYGDNGVYDFIGSPYNYSGWIICAPGITNTANKYLSAMGSSIVARNVTGTSLSGLISYLETGQPIIVWTTIDMGEPGGVQWYSSGYPLRTNNHAVVLTGYDPWTGKYQVSDSLAGVVWRSGSRFEYLYNAMGKQAVVLVG